MATALSVLPSSIVAGESFTVTLPTTVLITGRTCAYQFAATVPFSVACAVPEGGAAFVLTLTAANTLVLKSGNVKFAGFATTTTGGAVECIDSGYIAVEVSPLQTSNYTAALAAVDAAILKYASNPNRRVQLGDMSVEYRDLNDLLSLRSFYQSEIKRELGGRGSGPTRIVARFAW